MNVVRNKAVNDCLLTVCFVILAGFAACSKSDKPVAEKPNTGPPVAPPPQSSNSAKPESPDDLPPQVRAKYDEGMQALDKLQQALKEGMRNKEVVSKDGRYVISVLETAGSDVEDIEANIESSANNSDLFVMTIPKAQLPAGYTLDKFHALIEPVFAANFGEYSGGITYTGERQIEPIDGMPSKRFVYNVANKLGISVTLIEDQNHFNVVVGRMALSILKLDAALKYVEGVADSLKRTKDFVEPEFPKLAVQLEAPKPADKSYNNSDLSKLKPNVLRSGAEKFYSEDDYARAVQIQYWYVQAANDGYYNMACYAALNGQIDDSLYWLAEAAKHGDVSRDWANKDSDLEKTRKDGRWKQVDEYLQQVNQYWRYSASPHKVSVIAPADYKPGTTIPVMIGLHGMDADPQSFVNEDFQKLANDLHVAFVGISGTEVNGPNSFRWAEEDLADWIRVAVGIEKAGEQIEIDKSKVGLFGFSQGGVVSALLLKGRPDVFQGAIAISPGGMYDYNLEENPQPINDRCFVAVVGAEEAEGNIEEARKFADFFRRAKSTVILRETPEQSAHSFPADFDEVFPTWVKSVLKIE